MLKLFVMVIVLCSSCLVTNTEASAGSSIPPLYAYTKAAQAAITSQQVLSELKVGNERFVTANMLKRPYLQIAKTTSINGQYPIAIVLSCIDSRSNPAIIFDQGLGNIFSAAVAGGVISPNILASMEYATAHSGAKLVVVMGHTQCGAVTEACVGGKSFGHVHALIGQIKPAVDAAEKKLNNKNCANQFLIDTIAKQNVINQMQEILNKSTILADLVKSGTIEIVGAMHNIKTGRVTFFNSKGEAV